MLNARTFAAFALLAGVIANARADICYPDGHGGQVCNSGPEFFCTDGYNVVCAPGQPHTSQWCHCEAQVRPFICEMTVRYQRDTPYLVKLVPDKSCSQEAMQSALAVAAAKLSLGDGTVFYPDP